MSGQGLMERLPEPGAGTAVERAERPSPAQMVKAIIDKQVEAFGAVMPKGVDNERFGRLVLTAVKATPQLMECFGSQQGQTSVLLSAMQCAALGLEPNTATQDAWLLPRRNRGVMECELSIGYRGLLKLARRSGQIKSIRAEVVRENDEFSWGYGLEADYLDHKPLDGTDDERGPLTHAYAIVRFLNGGVQFVVLTRSQVEKRRAMSSSWNGNGRKYSPWSTWEDEMWKKTALRALVPHLELSTEDMRGLELEEQPLMLSPEGVIDVASETAGELPAGSLEEEPAATGVQGEVEVVDDPARSPEASPGGAPAESSSGEPIDWIERINAIEHGPTKTAAMKAFRAAYGMPPAVPEDGVEEAAQLLADFEAAARREAGAVEYSDEERAKLRRGLMAQATKAFPDKETRDAQRHALAWVVLGGGDLKSSTEMSGPELIKVTAWLKDVEDGAVSVELRDGVWFVVQGDRAIEVPAEVTS